MSLPKRIYDLFREIENSALVQTKNSTDANLLAFNELLNQCTPTNDEEKAHYSIVRSMYYSNPVGFLKYISLSRNRVVALVLYTESKCIAKLLGLKGHAHIKWDETANTYVVTRYVPREQRPDYKPNEDTTGADGAKEDDTAKDGTPKQDDTAKEDNTPKKGNTTYESTSAQRYYAQREKQPYLREKYNKPQSKDKYDRQERHTDRDQYSPREQRPYVPRPRYEEREDRPRREKPKYVAYDPNRPETKGIKSKRAIRAPKKPYVPREQPPRERQPEREQQHSAPEPRAE